MLKKWKSDPESASWSGSCPKSDEFIPRPRTGRQTVKQAWRREWCCVKWVSWHHVNQLVSRSAFEVVRQKEWHLRLSVGCTNIVNRKSSVDLTVLRVGPSCILWTGTLLTFFATSYILAHLLPSWKNKSHRSPDSRADSSWVSNESVLLSHLCCIYFTWLTPSRLPAGLLLVFVHEISHVTLSLCYEA